MGLTGEGLGIGLGAAAVSSIGNQILNQQQFKQEKELMGIQMGNQQTLNAQGHEMQMDMWNKTNYGAQIEHMKNAGLNPGLMYGMKGGGGTTTGSQSGGAASKGNAPQAAKVDMNALLMGAQLKNINAQTENTNAKTANELDGIKKGYEATNNRTVAELTRTIEQAKAQALANDITEKTKESVINKARLEWLGEEIKNNLNAAKIKLSEKQMYGIQQKIYQEWMKIGLKTVNSVTDIMGGDKIMELGKKFTNLFT